jgi:hypothetical protein
VESNAICVHWTAFGKENFESKAVRIVLNSTDKEILSSGQYFLHSRIRNEIILPLEKAKNIGEDQEIYSLYLYIKSENLFKYFPEGKNYYKDNCYQIELANLLGLGRVILKTEEKELEISKSENFTFHVGPISK